MNIGYLPYRQRVRIIQEWDRYFTIKFPNDEWQLYFLNFMYKQLPGSEETKKNVMAGEVQRVYRMLVPRFVRKPRGERGSKHLPVFLGCPDFPVFKNERQSEPEQMHRVNDGIHFNGVMAVNLDARLPVPFDGYMHAYRDTYCRDGDALRRIHITAVTEGTMIDYALKAFKAGLVSTDDLLLLPRTREELKTRPHRWQASR